MADNVHEPWVEDQYTAVNTIDFEVAGASGINLAIVRDATINLATQNIFPTDFIPVATNVGWTGPVELLNSSVAVAAGVLKIDFEEVMKKKGCRANVQRTMLSESVQDVSKWYCQCNSHSADWAS